MASTIRIANLYYILSYAWNHRLSCAELESVDAAPFRDLNNLFARLLAIAAHHLLRRRLDESYIPYEEETPRIRGRIDFSASEKQQTRTRGKLICVFDELSPDILHNRIVKATLRLLLNDASVRDANTRKAMRKAFEGFGEVGDLRVTPHHFHRVQLHRNNHAYHFILHLCELIHASLLPDKSADGSRRFRDFTRDETIMRKVFEDFVRNFAIRHLPEAEVSAMEIKWQATDFGEGTLTHLPGMRTDVTVNWPDRKLILDCKYYQDALVSRYDVLKFHTGNLYQLHAYLTNKAVELGWENVEGMLLYPSNGYHIDDTFTLHGHHRIRVSTIDLNQCWPEIESNLLSLFSTQLKSAVVSVT